VAGLDRNACLSSCRFLLPIPIQTLKVAGLNRNARQLSLGMGGRITSEQVAGLDRNTQTIERVALFSLLLTSGLRSGEIQALTWGKVWFEKNGIIIDQAVKYSGKIGEPKGKVSRALPIPKKTMTRLANWKAKSTHKSDTDFVFHQRNQIDPVRGDTILVLFKKALKKMNINTNKNLVIHSFRHTFTTVMSETLPAESVMAFTGHKSIQMIERYTHPDMKNALSNMKNKFDSNVTSIWDDKLNSQIPAETNLIGENWNMPVSE